MKIIYPDDPGDVYIVQEITYAGNFTVYDDINFMSFPQSARGGRNDKMRLTYGPDYKNRLVCYNQ
jgi:hypothetical protein